MKNNDHIHELIKHLEKDVPIDELDTIVFTLDKRFGKYIIFFNAMHGPDKDDIIIIESSTIDNVRKSEPFNADDLHPLLRMSWSSNINYTR